METCFRCDRSEKEIRLLDAVYENDMVKICEKCAITESMPIIKKPSTSQLKESEKPYTVYQRLKNLSGEEQEKKSETVLDQIRKLEENPELEKPEEKRPFNLIDNFHWHVQRARRNKGLSQRQLGWALGESETAIKMIEKGELPEDAEKLIRKLEQFFQTKLKERTEEEIEEEMRKRAEREDFKIPKIEIEEETEIEPESEIEEPIKSIVEEQGAEEPIIIREKSSEDIEEEKPSPAKVLSFRAETMNGLTVADLKQMKEEKEREERLAAVEEERKKALQADSLVKEIKDEERKKRELRERIASEMKNIALGKAEKEAKKAEGKEKTEEKIEKKEHIPTISELIEKKKEKSMLGSEIELVEEGKSEEKV